MLLNTKFCWASALYGSVIYNIGFFCICCSFFGKAFERAAEKTSARMLPDYFDSSSEYWFTYFII
jgi:hypothetical protein